MSVKDILIATKALIDTPEKWLQCSSHYRTADGHDSYCITGALSACAGRHEDWVRSWLAITDTLQKDNLGAYSIVSYNDHPSTTHKDVMSLLDRTIAKVE